MAPHWKCGMGQPIEGTNPSLSATRRRVRGHESRRPVGGPPVRRRLVPRRPCRPEPPPDGGPDLRSGRRGAAALRPDYTVDALVNVPGLRYEVIDGDLDVSRASGSWPRRATSPGISH